MERLSPLLSSASLLSASAWLLDGGQWGRVLGSRHRGLWIWGAAIGEGPSSEPTLGGGGEGWVSMRMEVAAGRM